MNESAAVVGGAPEGWTPDTREEWMDDASCAETDPDAFFPEKGGSTRDAKKICDGCAVREQCLEYALRNEERFGIWGGLSERQRRKLEKDGTPKKPAIASRVMWTSGHDQRLRDMHKAQQSDSEIARRLKVSASTVKHHREALGLPQLFEHGGQRKAS